MKLATNIHHASGIAQKVFIRSKVKVICVQMWCECYNGGGIHLDDVASRLTCSIGMSYMWK